MLGTDGRLYDRYYDYDGDGKLDGFERAMYDDDMMEFERSTMDFDDDLEDEF